MIQTPIRKSAVFGLSLVLVMFVSLPSFGQNAPQGGSIEQIRARAVAGQADAQYMLGKMYTEGRGASKRRFEGARWLRKSAEQGYAPAQYMVGYLWTYGGGGILPTDKPADIKPGIWFRKAAQQGHAGAQRELGKGYLYQTPENPTEAAAWLRKAAERGDGEAQVWVSQFYVVGQGVTADFIQAYKWASLAQRHLEINADLRKQAADVVRLMSEGLTPEQLQEAKALVRQWKPTQPN
jgi:TPR repeat protein